MNSSWGGASSFSASNNWFRVAADVALGEPGRDFPPTLHVLLKSNVYKIETSKNSNGKLRATCVQFGPTRLEDTAPIGETQKPNFFGLPNLLQLFSRHKKRFSAFIPPGRKYRSCVKPGGQIISSAGALLTPLLLYRSGIGQENSLKI